MQNILTEWRKYLLETTTAEYSLLVSNLIAWIKAGGKIPDSITNADSNQKQAIEWAKTLYSDYKGTKLQVSILQRDPKVIPVMNKLIKASKTVTGKDAEEFLSVRKKHNPFSNFFIAASRSVYRWKGIRVLDPTASKRPPKWAQESPRTYATWQTLADLLVAEPFSAAIMFIPIGKLGAVGVKAMQKAGVKGAAKLGAMPVGQAIVKYSPKKAGEIIHALNTTKVKSVVQNFNRELAKTMTPKRFQTVYGGAPWVDNYARAVKEALGQSLKTSTTKSSRQAIKKKQLVGGRRPTRGRRDTIEASVRESGELQKIADKVMNSISGDSIMHIFNKEYSFVILKTKHGKVGFYKSTGQSTPGLKEAGEWHLFGGFALRAPGQGGGTWLNKSNHSLNLTLGGDPHITKLSLGLERADKMGLLSKLNQKNLNGPAMANLQKINSRIAQMNKKAGKPIYAEYTEELLSQAYGNAYLNRAGALHTKSLGTKVFYLPREQNRYIGIDDLPASMLPGFKASAGKLPSLDTLFKT
jgi:hypothetical protein